MGKDKNKKGKSIIVISALIAFVVAVFCFSWYSNFNAAKTGLITPVIAAIIGGIFLLVNKLLSPSKDDDASPEYKHLAARAESLVEEKVKQAQTIEEKDQIIAEIKKKLEETEVALKERHASEALVRFKAGDYTEAEDLFAKELKEGAEKAANAAYYLGNIKLAQLKFDEALKYYQQAAELEPKNSRYLNELGKAYYTLGKYQEAIEHYEKALSINRDVHGEKHPEVATNLNNLGAAWQALGKYEMAIGYYEQALFIDKEIYGERHPNVATDLNNLGAAWDSLGKYDKAIEYYEQALSIDKEVYGKRHPDVAI
ncbi:MAG: tetratricopeptide repeat protein, partial [Candidatus Brocadiales bacterium]